MTSSKTNQLTLIRVISASNNFTLCVEVVSNHYDFTF